MTRAGCESRRTLCVWTPDYFASDHTVWFESLQARRRDPQGHHSFLVPLLLRQCQIPGEVYGLVLIDWTDVARRDTEWARLLAVLRTAPENDISAGSDGTSRPPVAPPPVVPPPPGSDSPGGLVTPAPVAINIAQQQILKALSAKLATIDSVERYWIYIAIGQTGTEEARQILVSALHKETDPFALIGITDALELERAARQDGHH